MDESAPRIYNLFPRLVGPISNWIKHLDRIEKMKFNWIYVNPLNYTGFSGSLYSIKNYFEMSLLYAKDEEDSNSWASLKGFIAECHKRGIKFMMDLVINHTAVDSPLISKHPTWYKEKWAMIEKASNQVIKFFNDKDDPIIDEYPPTEYFLEKRIANPFAIDPQDARNITIWGDLAEINYDTPINHEILDYWKKLFDFYNKLGIDGYRCDAAYQISPDVWAILIEYVKKTAPNTLFLAETLGCTLQQCEDVSGAGFDFIHSSSKWWDFTEPWCVEQYNDFRNYAPSISFPESHDTKRLALETNNRIDIQGFKYFFSCFFSAGVLMPIGYEFGFKKKLNVVDMEPKDWEEINFDISNHITQVNEFKIKYQTLNEDGQMTHHVFKDMSILILKKTAVNQQEHFLLIYNKDWNNYHDVYIPDLKEYLDFDGPIYRISIEGAEVEYVKEGFSKSLFPNEYILFRQQL
jgi:starch synthase (maltosyl-transferring)